MLEITPQVAKVDKFSDVKVTHVDPIDQEELDRIAAERRAEEIQYAMYKRGGSPMDFLTPTDNRYRENSGAESLDISLADGSDWSELFTTLDANKRRFFKVPTEAFVGETSEGDTRTPGIVTIQKTLDREAWKRGMILGYKGVETGEYRTNEKGKDVPVLSNDEFMLTARPVTKDMRIPKRIRNLGLSNAEFNVLNRTAENDQ